MRKDLLKASQDFVFKRVFGAESHKRVLICLLNAILKGDPKIESIELENTEIPKDFQSGKSVRLDIRAKTPDGIIVNIEIQCANRGELIHRSAFYQARMMPEEIKEGQSYNVIPNIISIWIADYEATSRNNHTNEIVYMYKNNEKDPIEIATNKFRTFIIELSKIEFKNAHRADMFSVWMMFIKHPELIPDEFLAIPEVGEAMDELTYLSHDKELREEYEARQRLINDERAAIAVAREQAEAAVKEQAEATIAVLKEQTEANMTALKEQAEANMAIEKEKSEAEGELKKAKEAAKNAISLGLSIEQAAKISGLSIEEIKKII